MHYNMMKGNSIWLESSSNKDALQPSNPLKTEQLQPQEMVWIKPVFFYPEPISPIFHSCHHQNYLSSWPQMAKLDQTIKQEDLSPKELAYVSNHNLQAIDQRLVFSQNEDRLQQRIFKIQQSDQKEGKVGHILKNEKKSLLLSNFRNVRSVRKGLKALSQRSYQILHQLKNASYKQVANKLIREMKQDLQQEKKQQMNVKRRVYDALNVLVSLGALKKDSRNRITCAESQKKHSRPALFDSQEHLSLKAKIEAKQMSINEKRRRLKEINYRSELITIILQRNRSLSLGKGLTIPFPFVGMRIDKFEVEKSKRANMNQLNLRSLDKLQLFGDIDALQYLNQSLERLVISQQLIGQNVTAKMQEQPY